MSIKLEVGKKYKNGRGQIFEIVNDTGSWDYPYTGVKVDDFREKTHESFTEDGKYTSFIETDHDLIEELP